MARKSNRHIAKNVAHRNHLLSGLLLVFALVAVIAFASLDRAAPAPENVVDLTGIRFEIADNDAERMQGLSDRESLPEDTGMMFVFGEPGIYPFWMHGMHFSLDMVWISGDTVVDVVTLPPPTSGASMPARHIPFMNADRVLELNAGEAERLGLTVGSTVILP